MGDGETSGQQPVHSASGTRARRTAIAAFALSGAAALIYEVVWTREMSLVFGSTVYAVSLMLGAFMTGLSLGSFVGGRLADRSERPIQLFGLLEMGIGCFGLLTIPLIAFVPTLYFLAYNSIRGSLAAALIVQLLISFGIMLVPTVLMGATFPVVSKIGTLSTDEVGRDVGLVYSSNTLGSIAGSISAGFLLIPLLGVRNTTVVAAVLNLGVGLAMVLLCRDRRSIGRTGGTLLIAALVAFGAAQMTPLNPGSLTMELYRSNSIATLRDFLDRKASTRTLYSRDAAEGPVVVLELADGTRQLRNSGATEGASVFGDMQTMRLSTLIPYFAHGDAHSTLVVGLGTGETTKVSLEQPGIERVDTVEINPAVVEASQYFVGDTLETDPRSHIYVGDARSHLAVSSETYDIITSEPSYPLSSHVTQLFTVEFFEAIKDRLSEDGVVCQWFPAYLLMPEDQSMMIKTFASVFPDATVYETLSQRGEAVDLFAVARKSGGPLEESAVLSGVEEYGEGQFEFRVLADSNEVARIVASSEIRVNTDDKPVLEFRTPINHIIALWRKD